MLSYQIETFGAPLAQVLRETPQPQGRELLLRVNSCGVCHSDLHLADGYFDLGNGAKIDLSRSVAPPRTLGHEIVGTVVALGPDVTSAQGVALGDRRVVYPWIGCGACALCLAGNEHLCNAARALGAQRDGGFSDHVMVPDAKYLLAFDPLPEDQACTYACSGLTAYSALKKCAPIGPGDTLLIIGAGGVGLSGVRLAVEMFGVKPIVAEIDPSKWDLARDAGAVEVIDPSAEGAAKALARATGGGVVAAIDFVGAGASFGFGFDALRKAGKLVCVGLFGGTAPVSPAMVAMKAVSVQGSYVGSLAEMHELMAIARQGKLPGLPLTTRPLAEAEAAMADLKAGRVRGRTILRP